MTTVLGAAMGRALRAAVAHIEGGLRSFDLRHPFPEELNRRLTSRARRRSTTRPVRGRRRTSTAATSSTPARTRSATASRSSRTTAAGAGARAGRAVRRRLACTASSCSTTRALLDATLAVAAPRPLRGRRSLFVDHSVTVAAARALRSRRRLRRLGCVRVPRLRFFDFVRLERAMRVRRHRQRRQPGGVLLPRPAVPRASRADGAAGRARARTSCSRGCAPSALDAFLARPGALPARRAAIPASSPSDVIVADLERRGFTGASATQR